MAGINSQQEFFAALNFGEVPDGVVLPSPASSTFATIDLYTFLNLFPTGLDKSRRTKLREALEYAFTQITTDNGYLIDIGGADSLAKSFEQIVNYPYVNINFLREEYFPSGKGGNALGRIPKKVNIGFDVFINDVNTLSEQRSKIMADMEKYFGTYYYVPDSDGIPTADNIEFASLQEWGAVPNEPYGGFTVFMNAYYHQAMLDPTSPAQSITRPALESDVNPVISVSIREQIRNALTYQLDQIDSNGQYNTEMNVGWQVKDIEQIVNFPYAHVRLAEAEYFNATDFRLQDRLLKKVMSLDIDIFVQEVNDAYTAIEEVLADIEKRVLNNFNLPDEDGYRTALEVMFVYNEPFGIESTIPLTGLRIGLNVYYRTDEENPKQSN